MFQRGARVSADGKEYLLDEFVNGMMSLTTKDGTNVLLGKETVVAELSDGTAVLRRYDPNKGAAFYIRASDRLLGPYLNVVHDGHRVYATVE